MTAMGRKWPWQPRPENQHFCVCEELIETHEARPVRRARGSVSYRLIYKIIHFDGIFIDGVDWSSQLYTLKPPAGRLFLRGRDQLM